MLGLRRALFALFAIGVLFAGFDVALVLASAHEPQPALTAVIGPVIGLSFIGTGVFAWFRRPYNRFGLLMVAVGFAWFLAGLAEANGDTLFTLGSYVSPLYLAIVVHMVLAFPTGRLETIGQRAIVIACYMDVLLVRAPYFVLGGDPGKGLEGARPRNALTVADVPDLADVFDYTFGFVAAVCLIATVVLLLRKRRVATAPQRRAQAPMLWTSLAAASLLTLTALLEVGGAPHAYSDLATLLATVAFAVLPFGFLAGLVRSRYSRAGAVGELIERLNAPVADESLRDALAAALGDRSLALVYWRESAGTFVDRDGRTVQLPAEDSGRVVTEVERDGVRVGAIIHDAALAEERSLVRAAAASAALALDNERLEAELRARLEELHSSRARLVEVSMFERRRLERDLHDGAQQRLVALSLQLGLARRRLQDGKDEQAAEILDGARDELARALEELRELARGIHPAVLTERGLGPALEALAGRAAVAVTLDEMPPERLPAPVEAAAYFVVAEALTNVAKYAGVEEAHVRVGRANGFATVEVSDAGRGGADPAGGSGLRGLADRLAALDGRLEVHSPPGHGTVVRAKVPCA
ncbi:MAG: histidine kinase [Solirubrobacteraceae bacterium]